MAKQPKWSNEDLKKLQKLSDERHSYQYISKELKRSVNGIRIALNRKLNYKPLCLGCGERIRRKTARLRCEECAKKRNEGMKKEYNNTPKMIEWRINQRDKIRFGNLREKVIKRDKEKCVFCGMTRKEHLLKFGCDITINHKDGKGRNSKKPNNKIDNLETLCLICHGKKDVVRRTQNYSMCGKILAEYNRIKRPRSLINIRKALKKNGAENYFIKPIGKNKFILEEKNILK